MHLWLCYLYSIKVYTLTFYVLFINSMFNINYNFKLNIKFNFVKYFIYKLDF